MKYMVNEIQKSSNGDINNITSTYDSLQAAESGYHRALASAAISQVPVHTVVLMSSTGVHLKHESYIHE